MGRISANETGAAARLLGFSAELASLPVPGRVVERAKGCLLDALGCALFGSQQPWSVMVREEMLSEHSRGPCTVIAGAQRLPGAPAALCNGTAIHGYELDDVIQSALAHPGAVVVPAALAAAEAAGASGTRLLAGLAAGYEANYRASMATGLAPNQRGFHMMGVAGPIAATVAAGVVMGLEPEELTSAVGLACSTASSIKSFAAGSGGGMVKRLHAGRAAEAGVRMCQLARRGFSGPPTALDGHFGFLEVFAGPAARPGYLHEGLGEEWALDSVWVKIYPICGRIQGIVQQIDAMRRTSAIRAETVKKITIGLARDSITHNGNARPTDTMDAQYSIPYCAAVALTGDPRNPDEFSQQAIATPGREALAQKVALQVDAEYENAYPRHFGARISIELANGETLESRLLDAHGTAADPCTEDEITGKFHRLAARVLSRPQAEAIAAVVKSLDQADSVDGLTSLLGSRKAGSA